MQPAKCPHNHVVIDTAGDFYFSAGELIDTLTDTEVCADCGTVFEPIPEFDPIPEIPALPTCRFCDHQLKSTFEIKNGIHNSCYTRQRHTWDFVLRRCVIFRPSDSKDHLIFWPDSEDHWICFNTKQRFTNQQFQNYLEQNEIIHMPSVQQNYMSVTTLQVP
jgi:hypothetical protein